MGYTKLTDDFAESSTCRLGLDAVGLWALILSKTKPQMDGHGLLLATPNFFASITQTPLERVEALFATFEGPDPESRSRVDEGRKLVRLERGWRVVNYREIREGDDTAAERARAYRRRKKEKREASRDASQQQRDVTLRERKQRRSKGDVKQSTNNLPASRAKSETASAWPGWSKDACDDWIARFGGTASGQIPKVLQPLVAKHGWVLVRPAWRSYLEQAEPEYASPRRFASTYGVWGRLKPVASQARRARPAPQASSDAVQLWKRIQEELRSMMPPQTWSTWIRPVDGLTLNSDILTVSVPGEEWPDYLRYAFEKRIHAAASKAGVPQLKFKTFVLDRPSE